MTIRKGITIALAAAAASVALGCDGSLTRDDAAATGLGGARGGAGGGAGAGGAGGAAAGQATDGGFDQSSCTSFCGRVETGLRAAGNCTYVLSCPLVGDFTGLAVLVDGQEVPRDAGRTAGWDYTDASMSAFQLFGQPCTDVLDNSASVNVAYLCELP